MNDYPFKIVRLQGGFVWHGHAHVEEAFLVREGSLRIEFRNGQVTLNSGELFIVPKGVEHKPFAEKEVKLLLIEPRRVPSTGDLEPAVAPPPTTSESDQGFAATGVPTAPCTRRSSRPPREAKRSPRLALTPHFC
jgi:hypothetical protein